MQQQKDNGAIVLDVREPEEFAEGHIIGAVNLPLSELEQGKDPGLSEEETYVVICRSGNRSVQASTILHDAGYTVINVSEGMVSWEGEVE
ncbi:rhodanese-like domain-containing protein [Sporosarcina obsidiansis]|uniref:rhodanese-like domain-containing protein n=1 Tax=Sporosarcina obsidiansis TaxID=2660748 RepID=UPI001E4CA31F|nr:rhodanese-like domain-containing protein [Sporosarcina obsidiansis]